MSLATAEFKSHDGDGVVFYDTVTMYVYPVRFSDEDAAWHFAMWLEKETGEPVNGQNDSLYIWFERYYDELLRDDKGNTSADPWVWERHDGQWRHLRKRHKSVRA